MNIKAELHTKRLGYMRYICDSCVHRRVSRALRSAVSGKKQWRLFCGTSRRALRSSSHLPSSRSSFTSPRCDVGWPLHCHLVATLSHAECDSYLDPGSEAGKRNFKRCTLHWCWRF